MRVCLCLCVLAGLSAVATLAATKLIADVAGRALQEAEAQQVQEGQDQPR